MIAITFALPQESKDLCAELSHSAESLPLPLPIRTGNIGWHETAVCHTGIGEASTVKQLRTLMKLHHPRGLISAGFAGGLDPTLRVGSILVATNFSDNNLLNVTRHICKDFDSGCYFGTLTTQPQVAETSDSKLLLSQRTRASAVDMETEFIAAACKNLSIPMLAVRAISDTASRSLPVPFSVWFNAKKQKPRVFALLQFLLRNPARIQPFIRFVGDVTYARKQLTLYLLRLLDEL